MIRTVLFIAVVKLATFAAGQAPAFAEGLPRPTSSLASILAEIAPEASDRACFGPGGRIVPCRRALPLR